MKRIYTLLFSVFLFLSLNAQIVIDINGNKYNTIKIGNQTWMAQNLASSKAPDGKAITTFPYLGVEDSVKVYGRIYDWENARKACPMGWHLPSDKEWLEMINFLGGPLVAGGKMKEAGTTHWKDPNTGASNESGFTALPGGYKTARGKYIDFKRNLAYFWTSTPVDEQNACGYYLNNSEPIIYRNYKSFTKDTGFAVRCVKD
jgi:uncharacterized protein (TIGR02145 family)